MNGKIIKKKKHTKNFNFLINLIVKNINNLCTKLQLQRLQNPIKICISNNKNLNSQILWILIL